MKHPLKPNGQYAVLRGAEYRLKFRGGRWVLWSDQMASGFTKVGGGYFREIGSSDRIECFRLSYEGTYRGLKVSIHVSDRGQITAGTEDSRAADAGFDRLNRDEWVRAVPADDPNLRITMKRTPFPAPNSEGGQ